MRRPGSGSATVLNSSPLSARTGPPRPDTTLTRYRPARPAAAPLGGTHEDLVGPDGIERLEAVEGDDHDEALPHASTVRSGGPWRQ